MGIDAVISPDETNIALARRVATSDREWFDGICDTAGWTSAGLFRRMRLAFEQSFESGQGQAGPNGVGPGTGRVVNDPPSGG